MPVLAGAVKRPLSLTVLSWADQVISPGRAFMGYQPLSMTVATHWVVAPGRRVRLEGVT